MNDKGGVGRELRPSGMSINEFKRSQVQRTTESSTPDQFGQQYNADYDQSKWSGESPASSRKSHDRADTDLSPRAIHHTIGTGRNQSSPGNHNHDGTTSLKIGPLEMDPANPGQTRAVWTVPTSPTVADVITLLARFVNFRQV